MLLEWSKFVQGEKWKAFTIRNVPSVQIVLATVHQHSLLEITAIHQCRVGFQTRKRTPTRRRMPEKQITINQSINQWINPWRNSKLNETRSKKSKYQEKNLAQACIFWSFCVRFKNVQCIIKRHKF